MRNHPVSQIVTPPRMTPTELIASLTTSKYALRTFRLDEDSSASSSVMLATFTARPASPMSNIGTPSTWGGSKIRR